MAGGSRAVGAPLSRGVVESYAALAGRVLAATPPVGFRLVAVDGRGAAGKSTFAAQLAGALGGVPVVHTDDFAAPDQAVWWPRLEEQVLRPLGAGRPGRYQRYDWGRRELAEWHDVPGGTVVLEGVSSSRLAVAARLTLAVWLQAPTELRLRRGIRRDGPESAPLWQRYEAAEDAFFGADHPEPRADLVVDGAPTVPHDPTLEYVRLR